MRSLRLDLVVREHNGRLWVSPRGEFDMAALPAFREKINLLASANWKEVTLDLDRARFLDAGYLDYFVDLLNRLRGRGCKLVLVFKGEENWRYFRRFSNLFDIHEKHPGLRREGRFKELREFLFQLSRRTGVRLSGGVALTLLVLVAGWLLTLLSMVKFQEEEIRRRETQLMELETRHRDATRELASLRKAIGPLKDLGLLGDSIRSGQFEAVSDWVDYLEALERRKISEDGTEGKARTTP